MLNHKNEHCPVCHMKAMADQHTVEYRKVFFHFCSEQCHETFLAYPGLYIGKRVVARGEIIKRRTLSLAEPLDQKSAQALIEYLKTLMGVKEVHAEGRRVTIQYDLLQLTLVQIEHAFDAVDVQLASSWWQRLKRAGAHNTEETELDNLAAPAGACCNHPPPRV